MIKKRYVIIPLLAFCLTATLFIATVTSGKKENPWDAISELQTKVDSLNATLTSRIDDLEGQISDLQTDITTLQSQEDSLNASIIELQSRVAELETNLIILNATKLGTPDYDSGWTDFGLSSNAIINHGLDTTHLLWYGLPETGTYQTIRLVRIISANAIEVFRTYQWDYHTVRILIWKISEP